MFAVITTVEVAEGSIPELASMFNDTNRALVADHDDWIAAWFTADQAASVVTVIAHWATSESYDRLRASDDFQQAMSQFATKFVGPPSISISEILVEM